MSIKKSCQEDYYRDYYYRDYSSPDMCHKGWSKTIFPRWIRLWGFGLINFGLGFGPRARDKFWGQKVMGSNIIISARFRSYPPIKEVIAANGILCKSPVSNNPTVLDTGLLWICRPRAWQTQQEWEYNAVGPKYLYHYSTILVIYYLGKSFETVIGATLWLHQQSSMALNIIRNSGSKVVHISTVQWEQQQSQKRQSTSAHFLNRKTAALCSIGWVSETQFCHSQYIFRKEQFSYLGVPATEIQPKIININWIIASTEGHHDP